MQAVGLLISSLVFAERIGDNADSMESHEVLKEAFESPTTSPKEISSEMGGFAFVGLQVGPAEHRFRFGKQKPTRPGRSVGQAHLSHADHRIFVPKSGRLFCAEP